MRTHILRAVAVAVSLLTWAAPAAGQATSSPPPQEAKPQTPLPPYIPPVTEEMRRAAFPDVEGHTVHDNAIHAFLLFDQFEWRRGQHRNGLNWDSRGWIGRDRDRFWFRTEGQGDDGRLGDAQLHLLYGRAIARWWEVVAGAHVDVRPGPAKSWVAVGIQGLAPYWIEVEATAYIGAGGRTYFRLEAEHELLLTNRLVFQPQVEIEIYGRSDPGRGLGRGLSSADLGLRLRYEIRREFAPYVGVTWHRTYLGTADAARAAGDDTRGARLTVGVRVWR